jgi:hypothetical protein
MSSSFFMWRGSDDGVSNFMGDLRYSKLWRWSLMCQIDSKSLEFWECTASIFVQFILELCKSARTPYSPYKKPVYKSSSCSKNGIWRHRMVQSEKSCLTRVHPVPLLIQHLQWIYSEKGRIWRQHRNKNRRENRKQFMICG